MLLPCCSSANTGGDRVWLLRDGGCWSGCPGGEDADAFGAAAEGGIVMRMGTMEWWAVAQALEITAGIRLSFIQKKEEKQLGGVLAGRRKETGMRQAHAVDAPTAYTVRSSRSSSCLTGHRATTWPRHPPSPPQHHILGTLHVRLGVLFMLAVN